MNLAEMLIESVKARFCRTERKIVAEKECSDERLVGGETVAASAESTHCAPAIDVVRLVWLHLAEVLLELGQVFVDVHG